LPLSTIFQLYRGGQFYWEEIRVPGENHRLAASHRQTLSHNVSYTPHLGGIRTHNFSKTDHHDISEIFLKVAFNTITLTLNCNVLKFISENEVWSTEEVEKYLNALIKCDKDFCSISKEVLF
jgi:hypothetical protein